MKKFRKWAACQRARRTDSPEFEDDKKEVVALPVLQKPAPAAAVQRNAPAPGAVEGRSTV